MDSDPDGINPCDCAECQRKYGDGSMEHCHCLARMHGSDHCPCCGCEEYEAYCRHICPAPEARAIEHADHVSDAGK